MVRLNQQQRYVYRTLSCFSRILVFVGILLQSCYYYDSIVVTAQVPTRAPNFGNLPCSICGQSSDVVTNPDTTITVGTLDFVVTDTTCGTLATDAIAAYFKPSQCKIIIESTIPDLCGCATPAVPGVPVPAPIPTPVTVPVANPVPAPTSSTNGMIVTSVSITLSNVVSTLNTPDLIATYNSVVTTFLSEILSSDSIQNLTATLINQNLLDGNSSTTTNTANTRRVRRLGERSLQTTSFPLRTDANITAIVPSSLVTDSGVQMFTSAIVSALSSNASDLTKAFQAADPTFFGTVTSIESSPTPPTVPVPAPVAAPVKVPAPAPTKSSDKGLSGGAIAGIVVGVIVLGGAVVGYFMAQNNDSNAIPPSSSQSRSIPNGGNDDDDGIKKSTVPQDLSSSKVYAVKASTTAGNLDDRITRVITAPPGKLGIVIDTTVNGPVVKTIKPDSPLEGKLFIGDIITLVDGVDTRAMNASAITNLIGETAGSERKITVLSVNKSAASSSTPVVNLEDRVTRVITAPPGKLGIVIDTTVNGPVVKTIKPESPLDGKLYIGDIITFVDGVDTRAMNASEITTLMVQTAGNERKITVLSVNKSTPVVNLNDRVTRVITAPPGKLGIVIDTTVNGPVVNKIKPNSTVEGKLFVGDIIISVDGVDTRAMNASTITTLMVQTADKERTITVLSVNESASGESTEEPTGTEGTAVPAAAAGDTAVTTTTDPETVTIPADDSDAGAVAVAGTAAAVGVATTTTADSTLDLEDDYLIRVVTVPPGKLGIVIDTTSKGPVVNKIKPNSPVEDKLYVGDIITEIDGVDCRGMSASALTAHMVKTSANERKLTVLSKEENLP